MKTKILLSVISTFSIFIFSVGAQNLQYNSSNNIYISPTPANVGIGTDSPQYQLHVSKDGWKARFSGSDGYIDIGPNNSSWAHIYTDRPNFLFNKPIYSTNGFYSYNSKLRLEAAANWYIEMKPRNPTHGLIIRKYDSDQYANIKVISEGLAFGASTTNEHMLISRLGYVGVGTITPNYELDINGNIGVTAPGSNWLSGKTGTGGINSTTQLSSVSYHPLIRQKTVSGHVINIGGLGDYFGFFGYDKDRTANGYDHSIIMNLNTGNVYIGAGYSSLNTGTHKLAVEGSIGAREVVVEASGWSDFVFEEDYNLPTLKEVEIHIKENGHLPDIPSAKEVEENGISIGEMNAKLLQKIEELTLYVIEKEKEINTLQQRIETIESVISNQ